MKNITLLVFAVIVLKTIGQSSLLWDYSPCSGDQINILQDGNSWLDFTSVSIPAFKGPFIVEVIANGRSVRKKFFSRW